MIFRLSILVNIFKAIAFVIATAAMLFSCSSGERMAKLIKKHPDLIKVNSTDKSDSTDKITKTITNVGSTTMVVPDSALNKSSATAPIVHDSNGVKTIIYHHNNTTYIHSECPPDTVIRETKEIHHYHTEIKSYPLPPEHDHWSTRLLYAACGALVLLLFLRLLKL